jgi:hypothetical protein
VAEGVVLEMVWEGGGGNEELAPWNNFLRSTLLILAEARDGANDAGGGTDGAAGGAVGGRNEELAPWNNFLRSTLLILAEAGDGASNAGGGADGAAGGAVGGGFGDGIDPEADNLPLTWPESTDMLPKDSTPSDLIGCTEAGEEEIGAEASVMEPKVTEGPMLCVTASICGFWLGASCFIDPIFRGGTQRPFFRCSPWLKAHPPATAHLLADIRSLGRRRILNLFESCLSADADK